jgi:nitrate/TMAO reductase-like tetraheme cytochrome c subunit
VADNLTSQPKSDQPILAFLTSHWLSMVGASLVTIAGCSWLLLLPMHIGGSVENPYLGILIFFAIPVVFFAGLALIPAGAFLARRRIRDGLSQAPDRRTTLRRLALFFGVMTVVNVVIGSQVSYRAVARMETVQFCGESCHVMKPQFTANQRSPHRNVGCVECHVLPGASGFIAAKINGSKQMIEVTLNTYPKPIPPALQSGKLASSAETCEQCHSRDVEIGSRLRVLSKFKDDEANTPIQTVLMMNVGGPRARGIHGTHMGRGVEIRYRAADGNRSAIPWVEYRNSTTGETTAYTDPSSKVTGGAVFVMECADCHNRPGHTFEQPDEAIDGAIASGQIPGSLPFVHKTGTEILKAAYAGDEDAATKIPAAFAAFYQQKYPAVASQRSAEVNRAGQALTKIYQRNVFADLGVKWDTYPNNLGHADNAGCFRCHDESHLAPATKTAAQKTITQDCSACHQALAVEETSPEVLKTLGLISSTQKP